MLLEVAGTLELVKGAFDKVDDDGCAPLALGVLDMASKVKTPAVTVKVEAPEVKRESSGTTVGIFGPGGTDSVVRTVMLTTEEPEVICVTKSVATGTRDVPVEGWTAAGVPMKNGLAVVIEDGAVPDALTESETGVEAEAERKVVPEVVRKVVTGIELEDEEPEREEAPRASEDADKISRLRKRES